jgi:membrane-associated phospholipid phosphatase
MMNAVRNVFAIVLIAALLAGCTMTVDPNFQPQGSSQQIEPQAGQWQTWVLTSGDELRPAAPPDSAATAAEIEELKVLLAQNDAAAQEVVAYWDAGSPSYRWIQIALAQYSAGPPGPRVSRALSLVNVAIYDATVAAWDAKYTYNRPHPSQVDSSVAALIDTPNSPSYPSEHAVAAGAASTILAYLFPDNAAAFAAQAEEAAQSRLLAGVHYPSDVEAGLELGRAVAEKVIEWAKADGSDVVWEGEIPTGPGMWNGENPVLPLSGTWDTWVLASGDQLRPPAPPAHDSEQILADLTEIKTITRTFPIVQKATYWHTFESAYPSWYNWAGTRLFERGLDRNAPYAARVYAAMSVANHDAIVACWDAKFAYWFIRPSQLDAEVVPLFPPPPHPSYPAAHGCASGSMGAILGFLFPSEAEIMAQLAEEAATTRIWGGIHYRTDVEVGLQLGRAVAQLVSERVQEMTQP